MGRCSGKKAKSGTLLWGISAVEQHGGSFLHLFFSSLGFLSLTFSTFLFFFPS